MGFKTGFILAMKAYWRAGHNQQKDDQQKTHREWIAIAKRRVWTIHIMIHHHRPIFMIYFHNFEVLLRFYTNIKLTKCK